MLKKLLFKKVLPGTAILSFATGVALAGSKEKPNIVQTAQQAGQFRTLLTAIKEAGLEETLAKKCCFTVFAPTDEAFAKALLYHVVEGKVYSKDLKDGQKVKTLQGQQATISLKGGPKIDSASIVKADIIDRVIIPG